MNNLKFLQRLAGVLVAAAVLAGCAAPTAAPIQPPPPPPPPPSPPTFQPPAPQPPTYAPPTVPVGGSLFKLVKEVEVTPSGNYLNADFARIGYVPGIDRFVVTFGTMLNQAEGGCANESFDAFMGVYKEYAYKEYTSDMEETGKAGIVSCHATSDTGGLFIGNDFYLASAETRNNVEGWNLAKFDALTWASQVDFFYPLADSQMRAGDPTVAFVNGLIDFSGVNEGSAGGTHHNFFTTDLHFVNQRNLSDVQNNGFSSLISQNGITYFLTSQAGMDGAPWSVIVMQYDPNWTYRGVKTLIEHAATPQGLAFDDSRYYVAYTERTDGFPFAENIHLAAFDINWNLVDDIALTSYTLQDQTSSIHPWLILKDNRLYVSYSQNAPAGGIESLQSYVKVYELTQNP